MATDFNTFYSKFKTPFFEITISDPTRKAKVKLPGHILKLVSKVEVQQSIERETFDIINITLVEGSREPASRDSSEGAGGVYHLDSDVGGSITNRTGVLTDLRFSGDSGVTWLTSKEKKDKKYETEPEDRYRDSDLASPRFLFEQRNFIKVKWGYLESPELTATVEAPIVIINSTFPETSQPTLNITCSTQALYGIKSPKEANQYRKIHTINSEAGIYDFDDVSTEEAVIDICKKAGISYIVGDKLSNDRYEEHRNKIHKAGQSLDQFLKELADASNAVVKIITHPTKEKDVLVFVSRKDWESQLRLRSTTLFNYRSPGSIIKRVSLKVDLSSIVEASNSGLDKDGNPLEGNSDHMTNIKLNIGEGKIDTNPDDILEHKNLQASNYKNKHTGLLEVTPFEGGTLDEKAENIAEPVSRILALGMTTLGYPLLVPGPIIVGGLGVRYSGIYRIMTTKHTITMNGYVTEVMGVNFAASFGQLKPDGSDNSDSSTTDIKLKLDKSVFKDKKPLHALINELYGISYT